MSIAHRAAKIVRVARRLPCYKGGVRRQDKADKIAQQLQELYPEPPIPLDHADPYTLLVAVALSAQTTDVKVNQVTPALFARAPTPEAMAALSVDTILGYIRQLGLAPQKAKALSGMAKQLIERFGGQVPSEHAALTSLPGVGNKTANVVLAQAFGQPAFPVDTHIHRLAARWGLSRARTADGTEVDLKRVFDPALWNKLHLQMIYFGREHCPARFHELAECPICSWAASAARIKEERDKNEAARKRRKR